MRISILAMAAFIAALPAAAQHNLSQEKSLTCDQRNRNNDRVTHCEIREQTLPFAGRLAVDAGLNGGISLKGWDQSTVLVRAKVEASGDDESAAAALASQVRIDASAGQVGASGPDMSRRQSWSVSFEVFVPRQGDLSLKAHNGGISVSDVRGNIQFETMNGGVNLKRLAGNVEGKTMNGGLHIELAGTRWEGTKLDARTGNGGVNIIMPENYSAHFEGSTVNGHLSLAFPTTVRGEIGKQLSTDIGSGGPTIHVETTNGGVSVNRAAL